MREDVARNIEIAVKMKTEKLSAKEIAEKMNRPVGTIKRWLAPYRLEKNTEARNAGALKGSLKMQENYALKRKEAYDNAVETVEIDLEDKLLRDFINIYIGEGNKRDSARISIVNSDAKIILLSLFIMKKYFLKENQKINLQVRHYKENKNEQELLKYWKDLIKDERIKFTTYIQPTVKPEGHNNSNQYGLVVVTINDTYAKQKLNAYMDYLKAEWTKEFEERFSTKFVERVEKKVEIEKIL